MEDKAQGDKEGGRGDHKPECASTDFRKNEGWPIGEASGLVPHHRSTCAPYHLGKCMHLYSSYDDLPISSRDDLALRLTSRASPFTLLFLSACSQSLLHVLHTFPGPWLNTFKMKSVPTRLRFLLFAAG